MTVKQIYLYCYIRILLISFKESNGLVLEIF